MRAQHHKLYVYVDETGQDTLGRLFIVVAIIVGKQRDDVLRYLEAVEVASGKGHRRKWVKSRDNERWAYLNQALKPKRFPDTVYYKTFGEGTDYHLRTAVVIAQSINLYCAERRFSDYKATVIVDGLNRYESAKIGATLRRLGVRTRKVRGTTDESNALIRLADALAGLVRLGNEGNESFTTIQRRARRLRLLIEL